jgi:hypothetical protein
LLATELASPRGPDPPIVRRAKARVCEPTSSTIPRLRRRPGRPDGLVGLGRRIPATKFASVERAAKPTTRPSSADDASTVWAAARSGRTRTAAMTPMNTITARHPAHQPVAS